MVIEWDDLPVVENAGRLGRRPPSDSAVADAYAHLRRDESPFFNSAAFAMGSQGANLLRDRIFPGALEMDKLRDARAPSYSTYSDCGPYDYDATCDEACFGFAPHQMDPFYCATCAEQAADPANNPSWNWHFVGTRGSMQYMDREPDVCAGKDAWKWKINGACGNCQESSIFRCHDGYKKHPDGTIEPTICQGLISCDNTLTTC
jgi:hypothetical protein